MCAGGVVGRQVGSAAYLPRWRKHRVGYVISVLFVGLGFLVSLLLAQVPFPFSLPGVLLLGAVVVITLLWGVGPAVFAILLSLFTLDYLTVPPFGTLGAPAWKSMLQLLTFALAGIGVAVLTRRYEAAFWRLLALERERLERDRKEAYERVVRETNQYMEAFLVTVSHELKTPLTVIKGSLQLCEQKLRRFVQSEEACTVTTRELVLLLALLEQAKQQVILGNRLVNDLVDISRIEADRLMLLKVPCDLFTIVREAVEEERRVSFARTICLLTSSERAVPVYADPDRLGQVVTNYLTNALKYSAADCAVSVRLEVEGMLARVSVQDEGPGLPLAEQERIWEPFYRVQAIEVQSGSSVGLGIGLSLCRTIIERHHGQVGVQSVPGKGSTFWFLLPLAGQGEHKQEPL
jgi:signal transduction histidine kinase